MRAVSIVAALCVACAAWKPAAAALDVDTVMLQVNSMMENNHPVDHILTFLNSLGDHLNGEIGRVSSLRQEHEKECNARVERHATAVADAEEAVADARSELVQAEALYASRRRELLRAGKDVAAIDADIKAAQTKLTKELAKGRESTEVLARKTGDHETTLSMVKELAKRVAAEMPSSSGVSTALLEIESRVQHEALRASLHRAAATRVRPEKLHALLARLQSHMVDSVHSHTRELERQRAEMEQLKANTKKRVTALARRRLELTDELNSMRRLVDQRRTLRDRAHAAVEAKEVELENAKQTLGKIRESCAQKSQAHRDMLKRHNEDIEMVRSLKDMIGGNEDHVKEIYNSYTGSTGATGATGGADSDEELQGPVESASGAVFSATY